MSYAQNTGGVPPYNPYVAGNMASVAVPAYAGIGRRFLALLIDGIIIGIIGSILYSSFGSGGGGGSTFVLDLLYEVVLLALWGGQTLGKKICGVRVVDAATGGPIGIGKALVRTLVKDILSPILLLGYLWAIWDSRKQTWHDKLAGTIVVKA